MLIPSFLHNSTFSNVLPDYHILFSILFSFLSSIHPHTPLHFCRETRQNILSTRYLMIVMDTFFSFISFHSTPKTQHRPTPVFHLFTPILLNNFFLLAKNENKMLCFSLRSNQKLFGGGWGGRIGGLFASDFSCSIWGYKIKTLGPKNRTRGDISHQNNPIKDQPGLKFSRFRFKSIQNNSNFRKKVTKSGGSVQFECSRTNTLVSPVGAVPVL